MDKCSLFDNIERNDLGPAKYSESDFGYLNRSARERYKKARPAIESWFKTYLAKYPKEAHDLRARFRSNLGEQHLGALTELYVYDLLSKNGYQDIIPHPQLKALSTHPEFLVKKNDKEFFIEAVTVFGQPDRNRSDKFQNEILDKINLLSSPDFLVSVKFLRIDINQQPPFGKIKKFIEYNLKLLDYRKVCHQIETDNIYPEYEYKESGWEMKFTISPVKEEARAIRTSESRVVGAILYPARHITIDEAIKNTIFRKLKKYGRPSIPFIIAANIITDSTFCDDEEIMAVLFGKPTIQVTHIDNGSPITKPGRTRDGLFIHPNLGVIHKRMSGLLVINGLTASTIDNIKPTLWHHPKADYPFNIQMLNVTHKIHNPKTDKMEAITAKPRNEPASHQFQ